MFPLLLIFGLGALAFGISRSGALSGMTAGKRTIPGPAGANVSALPPGSVVMTHDSQEAIAIVSQGPLGYFGHTLVSGLSVTFTPQDITMVQSVGPIPAIPPLNMPALPPALTPPTVSPTISAGRWPSY